MLKSPSNVIPVDTNQLIYSNDCYIEMYKKALAAIRQPRPNLIKG